MKKESATAKEHVAVDYSALIAALRSSALGRSALAVSFVDVLQQKTAVRVDRSQQWLADLTLGDDRPQSGDSAVVVLLLFCALRFRLERFRQAAVYSGLQFAMRKEMAAICRRLSLPMATALFWQRQLDAILATASHNSETGPKPSMGRQLTEWSVLRRMLAAMADHCGDDIVEVKVSADGSGDDAMHNTKRILSLFDESTEDKVKQKLICEMIEAPNSEWQWTEVVLAMEFLSNCGDLRSIQRLLVKYAPIGENPKSKRKSKEPIEEESEDAKAKRRQAFDWRIAESGIDAMCEIALNASNGNQRTEALRSVRSDSPGVWHYFWERPPSVHLSLSKEVTADGYFERSSRFPVWRRLNRKAAIGLHRVYELSCGNVYKTAEELLICVQRHADDEWLSGELRPFRRKMQQKIFGFAVETPSSGLLTVRSTAARRQCDEAQMTRAEYESLKSRRRKKRVNPLPIDPSSMWNLMVESIVCFLFCTQFLANSTLFIWPMAGALFDAGTLFVALILKSLFLSRMFLVPKKSEDNGDAAIETLRKSPAGFWLAIAFQLMAVCVVIRQLQVDHWHSLFFLKVLLFFAQFWVAFPKFWQFPV